METELNATVKCFVQLNAPILLDFNSWHYQKLRVLRKCLSHGKRCQTSLYLSRHHLLHEPFGCVPQGEEPRDRI